MTRRYKKRNMGYQVIVEEHGLKVAFPSLKDAAIDYFGHLHHSYLSRKFSGVAPGKEIKFQGATVKIVRNSAKA